MLKLYVTVMSLVSGAADRLRHDDEGATAVEYGLMIALIAAGIIAVVTGLRDQLRTVFGDVTTGLANL